MLVDFLIDYLPIILFLIIALILSTGFIVINFIFSPKNPDPEKLSAYECGFEPFNDSRMEFDVRFYLVAILWVCFNDDIFIYTNNWFYIRMEERCFRLGIK